MADASQTVPGDFNALYDDTARVARGGAPPTLRAAQPAIARMTNEVPNISVHLDEATQNPVQVTVAQGPEARGATRLSTRAAASPEAAARQFIEDRADLWQLNNDDIATVNVVSVSSTGLPTVRMLQKVDGVEVFQSDMTAAVGAGNNVISVSGQLFHGAAGAPHRAAARAAAAPGAGTRELQAEEAIAKAASDLTGHPYKPTDFKPAKAPTDSGSYRFYACKWKVPLAEKEKPKKRAKQREAAPTPPLFERPVRVKDVLFPLGDGQFVRGYYIELWIKGLPPFSYVVDAVDAPDILFRKNLRSRMRIPVPGPQHRRSAVSPRGRPAPGTPHPTGMPDGFQAPTIPEKLISIESLLPNRPWLPSSATRTRGNNCIAYADLSAPTAGSETMSTARSDRPASSTPNTITRSPPPTPRTCRPAWWGCSSTSTGCTTVGTRPASTRHPATRSGQLRPGRPRRGPDPGRRQRLQRH